VQIELVALSLQSVEPITVTFDGGQDPQQWNVRVELSSSHAQPGGSLTATKTHCNGGTFDSTLAVCPRFLFTRVDNPAEVLLLDFCEGCDPGGIVMSANDIAWVAQAQPGLGLIYPVCSGFVPGVEEPDAGTDCDCNENGSLDACDVSSQKSRDCNSNGVPDECEPAYCSADLDCTDVVDVDDLLTVLLGWDCTNPPGPCPGDVTRDGVVNVDDLVEVILQWGSCPLPEE
jgi:hypothetical protein